MKPIFENVSLIIVAAGCKNRCKHCSVDARSSRPALLSLEQVETVVTMVQEEQANSPPLYLNVNPCLMYEPMDHPDIVGIHKLLWALSPNALLVRTVATNGQRIAMDDSYAGIIHALLECGVEQFQLALHGVAGTHDAFAGRKGAYRDIMEAGRRIALCSGKIQWIFFLSKANIGEFPEMIDLAREASARAVIRESIDMWGPVGRAAKYSRLLVTAEDVERLPLRIKSMESLPEYRPESYWVEYAVTGKMQRELDGFLEHARRKGGVPDCTLRVTVDNVDGFGEMLAHSRSGQTPGTAGAGTARSPTRDLRWFAGRYGRANSSVLYRVSTMRQEWLRRWTEDKSEAESCVEEEKKI